jgi:hypothetical protein
VLNDRLADALRSGMFDDIDHFFKMPAPGLATAS